MGPDCQVCSKPLTLYDHLGAPLVRLKRSVDGSLLLDAPRTAVRVVKEDGGAQDGKGEATGLGSSLHGVELGAKDGVGKIRSGDGQDEEELAVQWRDETGGGEDDREWIGRRRGGGVVGKEWQVYTPSRVTCTS